MTRLTLVPPTDAPAVEIGSEKRTGYARLGGGDDGPMRNVQCTDCGAPMQVTSAVWEFAKLASSALIARGEPPLGNDEITRCKPCGELWCARKLEESLARERWLAAIWSHAKATGEFPSFERAWLRDEGLYGDIRDIDERCRKFHEGDGKARGPRRER